MPTRPPHYCAATSSDLGLFTHYKQLRDFTYKSILILVWLDHFVLLNNHLKISSKNIVYTMNHRYLIHTKVFNNDFNKLNNILFSNADSP